MGRYARETSGDRPLQLNAERFGGLIRRKQRPGVAPPRCGGINLLLETQIGTSVSVHTWSFDLLQPKGATHDEI
jgi:hypothetical protein